MNKILKIVSLFSGIGGFEEGFKLAGINNRVVFASEIDNSAVISYCANFGNENLYGDITKINEKDIPVHDFLVAGFPCQSFSIAGKQKGFDDIRGTLFFDVARILNEKKPKFILLENVKNLISHDKQKTIKKILQILNDLGYTVDFTVINAVEAGVPQNRERTYICGIYKYKTQKYEIDKRNLIINKLKMDLNKKIFNSFNFFNKISFNNKQMYIENILEKNVEERYYFNANKIIKYIEENNFKDVAKNENRIIKLFDLPKKIHNDLERQRRVYSIKGISPTVLARADSTKIYVSNKVRKITPNENFYIQGFSKNFVDNIKACGMSVTQMYKQSGNAVSPPVIAGIVKYLSRGYIENV